MYYDRKTGCYTGVGQTSRVQLPSKNQLKYLDLSGVGKAGDHGLEWKLLASCHCLEKLSLADCYGKMSDKIVQSLLKNVHTLRILDLQNFDLGSLSFTVCIQLVRFLH